MASIGLHLTKCAGTSLITSIRRLLAENEYLIISSFYENTLASRPQPWDVVDPSRLAFIFGHYVNESLFQMIRPKTVWDFFLFTGVREPASRAVSQYYQLVKVTGENLDVDNFVDSYGTSMCDEIIRAFPSLLLLDKPKWLIAVEALTIFDYIYSTENYTQTIGPVYESIGLHAPSIDALEGRDNVRTTLTDSGVVSAITSAIEKSDDAKLYSLIQPAIGKPNAGQLIAELINTSRRREEVFQRFCNNREKIYTEIDFGFLYDLMGYELHLLGKEKKSSIIELLKKKRNQMDQIIDFLEKRIY